MIIVIDGPAGSGKSSTARAVADRMNFEYIDSGALYRAATLVYLKHSQNRKAFFDALNETDVHFRYHENLFQVSLNGQDVTLQLRESGVAEHVSEVASDPQVREWVNRLMRRQVRRHNPRGNYIADGRDLSTVVFPDAELKFYMDCDLDTRARRRYNELIGAGQEATLSGVRHNLEQRDRLDSSRTHAPLKKSDDAIVIDTSGLSFREQTDIVLNYIDKITSGK